jgi:hypothetical protein
MTSTIKLKRSDVPGKVPLTTDLELGELAVNTHDGKIFLKTEVESVETIQALQAFIASNPVANVYYVQKNGSDANTVSGTSWDTAFLTIERAIEEANTRDGELTLIDIGPGTYTTQGHIDVPDNCLIRAVHRSVVIRPEPGYEERNVFRLGSGCFIEGPIFEDFRLDSLDTPSEGFAISFRPGAVIRRAPYAHKIAVRTTPFWDTVAPPLDRDNQNPLIGVGAGVALADGSVCSPYSIYPNIMTWGATPVSHNGIGYVAKNGALINAVNAISIWAHKHFLALSGGQIILSSCSTQFGDFTMVASGSRLIIQPTEVDDNTLTIQTAAYQAVDASANTIINDMWDDLVSNGYTAGWTEEDEVFTRRDASTVLQSIEWVLQTANQKPMLDFAKGLFDTQGNKVYDIAKEAAFIHSFEFMRDEIIALPEVNSAADTIVTNLVAALINTLENTSTVSEPSTITAISHTWTAIMAGVALTKIPPARNFATIEESVLELDNGIVIASGQDDQGSALFIGGMKIDSDTGELTGPPFEQSVNRIATRAAIARSF